MKRLKQFIQVQLFLTLIAALTISGHALAGLLCRADPLVILSNGVVIDFGATISTLPMQVQEVHYELHVPVGLQMIAAVHTPTWLTSQETFTLYADQPPGQYYTTVIVRTSTGNATVVADATLVSPLGLRLGRATAPGVEGQVIPLRLRG